MYLNLDWAAEAANLLPVLVLIIGVVSNALMRANRWLARRWAAGPVVTDGDIKRLTTVVAAIAATVYIAERNRLFSGQWSVAWFVGLATALAAGASAIYHLLAQPALNLLARATTINIGQITSQEAAIGNGNEVGVLAPPSDAERSAARQAEIERIAGKG